MHTSTKILFFRKREMSRPEQKPLFCRECELQLACGMTIRGPIMINYHHVRFYPMFWAPERKQYMGLKGQNTFCAPKHGFLLGAAQIGHLVFRI